MIYKITLRISDKEYDLKIDKTEFKSETEKETTVLVNGFKKKIPHGTLNKIRTTSLNATRNVELYENYIFANNIAHGVKELLNAYDFHIKKANKTIQQYTKLVEYAEKEYNISEK